MDKSPAGTHRTVCTYAVGLEKLRHIAITTMLHICENAASSVDRYFIFRFFQQFSGLCLIPLAFRMLIE